MTSNHHSFNLYRIYFWKCILKYLLSWVAGIHLSSPHTHSLILCSDLEQSDPDHSSLLPTGLCIFPLLTYLDPSCHPQKELSKSKHNLTSLLKMLSCFSVTCVLCRPAQVFQTFCSWEPSPGHHWPNSFLCIKLLCPFSFLTLKTSKCMVSS